MKALIWADSKVVVEVVGNMFDVHETLLWRDVPADQESTVETGWAYNPETQRFSPPA